MVFISNMYKKQTEASRLNNSTKRYQSSEVQSQDYSSQMPASYCHNNVTRARLLQRMKEVYSLHLLHPGERKGFLLITALNPPEVTV